MVLATDLDNTLIHSYKQRKDNDLCIEYMDDKMLSFIDFDDYKMLQKINEAIDIIPVTTRSLEQYNRINLFNKRVNYAITDNGGILLWNGEIDKEWYSNTMDIVSKVKQELTDAIKIFEKDDYIYRKVSMVDGIFLFAKSSKPQDTILNLKSGIDKSKVDILSIGDKVYVFPININKGYAVDLIKKKNGINKLICCGDSDFDIPMLCKGDIIFSPNNLFFKDFPKESLLHINQNDNFTKFIVDTIYNKYI